MLLFVQTFVNNAIIFLMQAFGTQYKAIITEKADPPHT